MKKFVMLAVLGMMSFGCGKNSAPEVVTPTNGSSYTLPGFSAFTVTLADNDYNDTAIEFYGVEAMKGRVSCQATTNGPATCMDMSLTQQAQQTQATTMNRCTQSEPCHHLIGITVRRGDYSRTIFVTIVDIGPVTGAFYR